MISPKAQARFHKYVAYGPTTPKAWEFIPKDQWDRLPSSPQNLKNALFLTQDWWGEHHVKLQERWQAFLQK